MSRHPATALNLTSPRNVRLGTLILVFIAINQIDDPLVDPTIAQELAYWFVRISVLAAGLWIGDLLVWRLLPARWSRPAWLKPVLIATAIGLLPFALAEILIEPHLPMRPEFQDDELWAYSPLLAFLSEYATVVSIIVPVHLLLWLILDRRQPADTAIQQGVRVDSANAAPSAANGDAPSGAPPAFLERSAVARAEDVIALQAEEHYVRVFTREDEALIHCRFGDAVKEMPQALGLRVHRSWWVADDAVRSASRGARRWQLTLETGTSVPVSDSYVKAVREAGWLSRKGSVRG